MVPHIGNQENKINAKRMSHSKEYLTIVKWETTDKRLFDTQVEADAHQKAVDKEVASLSAGKYLSAYFEDQWKEIKIGEENIAVGEQRISETIVKRNSISNALRKLKSKGGKLSAEDKKKIQEYEKEIEQLDGDIAKQKQSLADDRSKFDTYMSTLYLPLLDAYTPYQSQQIFAGNYDAIKDLVIDNTAKFLSIVTQIADDTDLGAIRLGPGQWWPRSAKGGGDKPREFPAKAGEYIAMTKS